MTWLSFIALSFVLAFMLFFSQSHVKKQDAEIAAKKKNEEEEDVS